MAGVVIEPVQAEGGDHHGSPAFFQVSRSQNSPSSEKKRCGAGLIGSSVFFCWCSGPASADAQTRRGADRRRGADGRRRLGQILVPRTLRSAQTGRPRHLQQEDAHWWILQFARVQVVHHPDPFRCQSRVPAVTDRLSLRGGLLSRLVFFLFGFKTACQLVSNWNETTRSNRSVLGRTGRRSYFWPGLLDRIHQNRSDSVSSLDWIRFRPVFSSPFFS